MHSNLQASLYQETRVSVSQSSSGFPVFLPIYDRYFGEYAAVLIPLPVGIFFLQTKDLAISNGRPRGTRERRM